MQDDEIPNWFAATYLLIYFGIVVGLPILFAMASASLVYWGMKEGNMIILSLGGGIALLALNGFRVAFGLRKRLALTSTRS